MTKKAYLERFFNYQGKLSWSIRASLHASIIGRTVLSTLLSTIIIQQPSLESTPILIGLGSRLAATQPVLKSSGDYLHCKGLFLATDLADNYTLSSSNPPGNHCLRVGGFNSRFVSKTLCILSINLLYYGHPRGWLLSRERNRHHIPQLQARTRITDLTEMGSNKCLEASRFASRWEPVSTDRKRLTTLPQYKTWLFNTRESVSKSRREVEAITTKLVASLVRP